MRIILAGLFILLLLPIGLAVIGEGETYKVRHKPDYGRFLEAFGPYKAEFLRDLRMTRQTIYDARLRKTWPIESVNDEWLLQILYDKQSRDWNHIELPPNMLAAIGTEAERSEKGVTIKSGVSYYPSFTKHKTGGTFLASRSRHLDQEGLKVTPEEIAWVRLNMYSLRNPVTQRNVRVASLSDEQITAYLIDRKTRKIAEITPEKAKKDLQTLTAYYKLFRQRYGLR